MVAGTHDNTVYTFDLRNPQNPNADKMALKLPITKIKCFPQGNYGYLYGSIEGRIGVVYVNQLNEQFFGPVPKGEEKSRATFTFTCHRNKNVSPHQVSSVNDIAFHPRYGTFATVGAQDHKIIFWDKDR